MSRSGLYVLGRVVICTTAVGWLLLSVCFSCVFVHHDPVVEHSIAYYLCPKDASNDLVSRPVQYRTAQVSRGRGDVRCVVREKVSLRIARACCHMCGQSAEPARGAVSVCLHSTRGIHARVWSSEVSAIYGTVSVD